MAFLPKDGVPFRRLSTSRRQLDDLWEVKATQTPSEFTTAAAHVGGDKRYPIDVVYALLGGASPTAAWRLFRKMTRTELENAAGVSPTGLSSIERGPNSGNQVRDELAIALAIPAYALIALFLHDVRVCHNRGICSRNYGLIIGLLYGSSVFDQVSMPAWAPVIWCCANKMTSSVLRVSIHHFASLTEDSWEIPSLPAR